MADDAVKIDVVCPCGHLLHTRSIGGGNSRILGTTICPACKRWIKYTVRDGHAYTKYE